MTTTRQTVEVLTVEHAAVNGIRLTAEDILAFADKLRAEKDMPGDGAILLNADPETRQFNIIAATAQRLVMPEKDPAEDAEDEAIVDDWIARGRPRGEPAGDPQ